MSVFDLPLGSIHCWPLLFAVEPRYEAAAWQALLADPVSLTLMSLLAALALLVAIYSAWREQVALKPGRWRWLAIMRVLALVAVGFLLAGWQRRPVTEQTEPSRVVMLVDGSTSMSFAADGNQEDSLSRSESASQMVRQIASGMSPLHSVKEARFGSQLTYRPLVQETEATSNPSANNSLDQSLSFYAPRDAETRLGEALQQVLDDHRGVPLAAVVVCSDGCSTGGVTPQRVADQFAERGIMLHTVGLGALTETKQVQLRGMSVPRSVHSGDPFEATVRLAAQGGFEGEALIELLLVEETESSAEESSSEESPSEEQLLRHAQVVQSKSIELSKAASIVTETLEVPAPPPGRYRLFTRVSYAGKTLTASARLESVDRKTTVLLLASGPLRDYRFLRNQLFRDDSFIVDACLQTARPGISQDVRTMLEVFPEDEETLDAYDVVVTFDANWEAIGLEAQKRLQRWVVKKGGGLLVISGTVFNPQLISFEPESPLGSMLPVLFKEDPLTLAVLKASRRISLPIRLTPAGEQVDFMQLEAGGIPASEHWNEVGGMFVQPLEMELKLGATSYAMLGEEASADAGVLLSDQYYGAGRVAYLSTPEIWRLRRVNTNWFTAFYTRFLRHLARGRLQGADAAGNLFFDRDQYQVGQTIVARLTQQTGSGTSAESDKTIRIAKWVLPSGQVIAQPMQPVPGQPNSFQSVFSVIEAGEYEVKVSIPLYDEPLIASATATLPPLESAQTLRNETLLKELAEKTSGIYCATLEETLKLVENTPSQSEVRLLLGPVDDAYSEQMVRYALWAVVGLLCLEWLTRRLWRLA